MQQSHFRKSTPFAALVLTLLATLIAPGVDAQEAASHPRLSSGPALQGEEREHAAEVQQFAAQHRLAVATARRYFALAKHVNRLGADMRASEIRNELGGLYLDTRRWGYVVIQVAGDMDQVENYARSHFAYPEFIEFQPVPNSLDQLEHVISELTDEVGPAAITAMWLDEPANVVRVDVLADQAGWQQRMDARFGPGIVAVELTTAAAIRDYHIPANNPNCEDSTRNHCNPLRAGIRLHRPNLETTYCTAGFPSTDNGRYYVITAAHCQRNSPDLIRHSNSDIGGFVSPVVYGGNVDAVRLRLDIAQWGIAASYWRTSSSPNTAVMSVFAGTFLDVGTPVCSSGVRTGHLCGTVRASNVSGTVDGVAFSGLIGHTMCTNQGDSGAPVVNSGTAIAVHKGEYRAADATGCYTWSSWVANVQQRIGTTIIEN